jgi:DNA-binding CsgD family transcriptional regulator
MGGLGRILYPAGTWPLLGLSFAFTWTYAPYFTNEMSQLPYRLGFACVLLVMAVVLKARLEDRLPRMFSVVAAISMCSIPMLVIIPGIDTNPALSISFSLLGGFGAAICFAQWFALYCRYDIKFAVNYTLISFSLSACIRLLLVPITELSPVITFIILCMMPFFSLRCIFSSEKTSPGSLTIERTYSQPTSLKERPALIGEAGFIVEVIFYGFIFGFMRNLILEWSNTFIGLSAGYLIRITLPLFLLMWINIRTREDRLYVALRWVFAVTVIVLLAVILFNSEEMFTISSLILMVRNFTSILLNIMLFRIVRDADTNPLVAYGIGRGVYEFFLAVGLVVFSVASMLDAMSLLSPVILSFCVICIGVLLIARFNQITFSITNDAPKESVVVKVETLESRTKSIAKEYNLSERETEIMKMICMGRSKRYIAETLYLSEETIRWYSKQLYQKLAVHNKQDLISLLKIE